MAARSRMPFGQMVEDMTRVERFILGFLITLWLICAVVFWSCPRCYAAEPQYFTNASWVFSSDTQHFLTATINGIYRGRVALGTYYQIGTAYLVPDEIYKNGFGS